MINQEQFKVLAQKTRGLKPTNTRGLQELFLQLLWLASGFVLFLTPKFWILGQLILGFGFWRSFAILHACGHHSFCRSSWMNHCIGFIFSPLCLIPYWPWKYIHQDHHLWTGWKDLDPTTKGTMQELPSWKKNILNFCWRFWIPLISLHYIFSLFYNPYHTSFRRGSRRFLLTLLSIMWVLAFHITFIGLYPTQWAGVFGVSLFIYLNLGDLSLLTQHVHLPLDHSQGKPVTPKPLWEQDQYSHTLILPHWMEKWFILGFNHHALHHLFPRLPFYHSYELHFIGAHTQNWKSWIAKAKAMKASDLIFTVEDLDKQEKESLYCAERLIDTKS